MRNGLISILKIKFSRFHNFTEHENKLNRFSDWTVFILLKISENESFFSPISQLNYSLYAEWEKLISQLKEKEEIQCILGKGHIPFGQSQRPAINDYADGIDSMQFLLSL